MLAPFAVGASLRDTGCAAGAPDDVAPAGAGSGDRDGAALVPVEAAPACDDEPPPADPPLAGAGLDVAGACDCVGAALVPVEPAPACDDEPPPADPPLAGAGLGEADGCDCAGAELVPVEAAVA